MYTYGFVQEKKHLRRNKSNNIFTRTPKKSYLSTYTDISRINRSNSFQKYKYNKTTLSNLNAESFSTSTKTKNSTLIFNQNFSLSHISYELISVKNGLSYSEENALLKQDIVILISQLREREKVIEKLRSGINGYIKQKEDKYKAQIYDLRNEIKKLKKIRHPSSYIQTEKMEKKDNPQKQPKSFTNLSRCNQYGYSYIQKTIAEKITRKHPLITNHISIKNIRTTVKNNLDLSQTNSLETNNQNPIFFYKPFDSSHLLQYEATGNKFKLLTFADYSDFTKNYIENGSAYITINNIFYIITGKNYNLVYSYSSNDKSMRKLPSLTTSHQSCGMVKYNDNLMCLSGIGTKSVESYHPLQNSWEPFVEMNKERSQASHFVVDNKIYSMFGYSNESNKFLEDFECYDGEKWNLMTVKFNFDFKGVKEHTMAIKNNIIYLVGGERKNKEEGTIFIDMTSWKGKIEGKEKNINFNCGMSYLKFNDSFFTFDIKNNVHRFCINKNVSHKIEYY